MNPAFVLSDIGIRFASNKSLANDKVRKLFSEGSCLYRCLSFKCEECEKLAESLSLSVLFNRIPLAKEIVLLTHFWSCWLCSFQVQGCVLSAYCYAASFNPHRNPRFSINLASSIMMRKLENKEITSSKYFPICYLNSETLIPNK